MKRYVIATLLGLSLSLPALASNADCAQQMRSHSSKAASGYVYVNRLDAPERSPVSSTGRTVRCPVVIGADYGRVE